MSTLAEWSQRCQKVGQERDEDERSCLLDSKTARQRTIKRKTKMSTLTDWTPLLPEEELGKRQKMKMSTIADWMPTLPEIRPDERAKTNLSAFTD